MSITEEAKRCLKCKNARCSKNCPLETPVPLVSGPRTVAEAVAFAKKAASEIEAYCLGTK